jgi:hypothetical protein
MSAPVHHGNKNPDPAYIEVAKRCAKTLYFGIPVGGTTGLSHEHSAAIDAAAEWLASTPQADRPKPIVPHLQRTFGLTAKEACEAIREARS